MAEVGENQLRREVQIVVAGLAASVPVSSSSCSREPPRWRTRRRWVSGGDCPIHPFRVCVLVVAAARSRLAVGARAVLRARPRPAVLRRAPGADVWWSSTTRTRRRSSKILARHHAGAGSPLADRLAAAAGRSGGGVARRGAGQAGSRSHPVRGARRRRHARPPRGGRWSGRGTTASCCPWTRCRPPSTEMLDPLRHRLVGPQRRLGSRRARARRAPAHPPAPGLRRRAPPGSRRRVSPPVPSCGPRCG